MSPWIQRARKIKPRYGLENILPITSVLTLTQWPMDEFFPPFEHSSARAGSVSKQIKRALEVAGLLKEK